MAVAVRFEYEGAGRSRRKMRMIELILKASGGEGSRSVVVKEAGVWQEGQWWWRKQECDSAAGSWPRKLDERPVRITCGHLRIWIDEPGFKPVNTVSQTLCLLSAEIHVTYLYPRQLVMEHGRLLSPWHLYTSHGLLVEIASEPLTRACMPFLSCAEPTFPWSNSTFAISLRCCKLSRPLNQKWNRIFI